MPSLSGSLIDVTSAPSDATEVWIRAADGRVSGANVVLEETRRAPVNAGKFTVTVLPGRAHLVVIHAGMSQEHVPLLVQDGMTTIAEAVRLGAADWEEYSPSEADQIKSELAAEVAKAATSAQAAKSAQTAAEKARTDTQNALSTKADKVHTHVSADITDAQNGYTLTSVATNVGKLVEISSNGTLEVHAANMTNGNGNAVTNKAYVDGAVAGKANTGHKHEIADVNGLQALLAGIMPRSYVLRPVTDQPSVSGRIVAGKRPGDTDDKIKISAGVHLLIVDYPKEIRYSIWGPDGAIFGGKGSAEARVIRAVVSKPGTLVVFMSAPADEQATTTLGLTIIPGQAPT